MHTERISTEKERKLYHKFHLISIVQITDPHFYSSKLTDDGNIFRSAMSNAAGRDALHMDEILESFYQKMLDIKPSVLIVSGDLTLNGARKSHEDFANYLSKFEENGIEVLVIPGNHDINSTSAKSITDNAITSVGGITPVPSVTMTTSLRPFAPPLLFTGPGTPMPTTTESLSYLSTKTR